MAISAGLIDDPNLGAEKFLNQDTFQFERLTKQIEKDLGIQVKSFEDLNEAMRIYTLRGKEAEQRALALSRGLAEQQEAMKPVTDGLDEMSDKTEDAGSKSEKQAEKTRDSWLEWLETGEAAIAMGESYWIWLRNQALAWLESEEGIEAARAEATALGLTNTTFEVQDASKINAKNAFDFITTFDAIHDQAKPDVG